MPGRPRLQRGVQHVPQAEKTQFRQFVADAFDGKVDVHAGRAGKSRQFHAFAEAQGFEAGIAAAGGGAGFGFLSLAVMIFGQWKPQRIALAALLFGFFRALGNVYTGFSFLKAMNLPSSLYNMLPYIISLIVLAFTSKNSRAPKAEGIPYDKGMR